MSDLPVPQERPARTPLRRNQDGRMIAGVASALARHLNLSVGLIRMAFVIAALFSGVGVLAYGALKLTEADASPVRAVLRSLN